MKTPAILWFRHSLRLEDNKALEQLLSKHAAVLPVFLWAPEEEGDWAPGRASRAWLHRSLSSLDKALKGRGSRLILRRGPVESALIDIARESGANAVYCSRRPEPAAREQGRELRLSLESEGIELRVTDDGTLFPPGTVLTAAGGPYRVFTPFWRALQNMPDPGLYSPAPDRLPAPDSWPSSLPLEELDINGGKPGLDGGHWEPGEHGALGQLADWQGRVASYEEHRNRPDLDGTSRLSPHLHFGEISPGRIWYDVSRWAEDGGLDGEPYLRQLAWREFSINLLHAFPHTDRHPLMESFQNFPWRRDVKALAAWREGRTGFPIVDAGMRQLEQTGWMHNRVRMIAASFLVKDLLIHWYEGARWFWDRLVDADLANNTMGWQWTSGCGADAAPYFRVFNPMSQGKKFDPRGEYVRQWVPELASLPDKHLHAPWEAPATVLGETGVTLGSTYPHPIVDHAEARLRALDAYEHTKQGA